MNINETRVGIIGLDTSHVVAFTELLNNRDNPYRCIGNNDTDVVIGFWQDGRMGVLRGIRKGEAKFGAMLFREKEIQSVTQHPDIPSYVGLMKEIVKFFQTGRSPVPLDETIEIVGFLEAANASRAKEGQETELSI